MSPSPFAVTSPTDPASYSWEATDEGVAERFGIPVVAGAPVRPQHVARAARDARPASSRPTGSRRRSRSTRPATTAGSSRPRRPRYGVAFDEVVPGRRRGRDPRHVHEGVPARGRGGRRSRSRPTPMYRDPRRAARRASHRRAAPLEGRRLGDGRPGGARRGPRGDPRLGLQPQQPDRPPRARRHDRGAPRGHRGRTPRPTAAPAPAVVVDEAYSEFIRALGDPAPPPASRTSSRSAPPPRRTRWPGCGSGSRSAPRETIAPARDLPAAGLDRHRLRDRRRGRAARTPTRCEANVARVEAERPRLAAALAEVGWDPQPSVTNFLLLDLATAERSEAAALALMAPRPRAAHVRARPSARPLPARHRPRPGRGRAPDRGRVRDRPDPAPRPPRRPPHDHAARHARGPEPATPPRDASPGGRARPTSRSRSTSTAPGTP